ncbi:MAG: hypothetical protein EXS49_00120 [Candidatus Pacebacteria bacterium]|nr:hypothetical protein [Candidatus Paceibacterota bacterium]
MEIHQNNLKKKRRRLKFELYFILVIFLCEPILALKTIKDSSIFQIKNLEISGIDSSEKSIFIENLKKHTTRPKVLALLGENNILSWESNVNSLKFLEFNNINLKKDFLNMSINVTAEKSKKISSWCFLGDVSNKNCFWVSYDDGMLLGEAPQTFGGLYIGVIENSSRIGSLGIKVLEDNQFLNFKKIFQELNLAGIIAEKVEYKKIGDALNIQDKNGTKLLFNLSFDPTLNLEALKKILQKSSSNTIEYIDLSVEGKIYVKPR